MLGSARTLGGTLSTDKHLPLWLRGPLPLPPMGTTTGTQRRISSAWNRTMGGRVSPRACAALRLMTSWYLAACSTGRAAGVAP